MVESQVCHRGYQNIRNLAFLRTKVAFYTYTFLETFNLYCIEKAEQ